MWLCIRTTANIIAQMGERRYTIKSVNATLQKDGEVVGMLIAAEKDFSTGSRGFYTNTKVIIDGKSYVAMLTLVEVGSKPAGK